MLAGVSFGSGGAEAQNYGAIAYSPATGALGWSYDYRTRGEAESIALQNCSKHASDCIVPLWFRNACGALAVGSNGWGTAWGTNQSEAERKAITACQRWTMDCAVKRWVCTTR
jgi:serine/threonine-protein kinase